MSVTGSVRQPRAWVNGIPVLNAVVYLTRQQSASEFTAEMALDVAGTSWGCSQQTVTITATNGDGSSGTTMLAQGKVDKANIDWNQRIVAIHGRDLTSQFLDTRSDHSWTNTQSLQVIQQIAAEHGLGVVTDGGGAMAGKTFDHQEYEFHSDIENEWDVITSLAKRDGKTVFVAGNTLYYVSPGYIGAGTYAVEYTPPTTSSYESANVIRLRTSADLEAQGQVLAASQHTNDKQAYTSQQSVGGGSGGSSAQYYAEDPGLIQDQVQTLAQKLAQDVQTFQRTIEVVAPGDVAVNQLWSVMLSGTQSCFDQQYFIETVTHRFDWHQGYTMVLEGKTIPDS